MKLIVFLTLYFSCWPRIKCCEINGDGALITTQYHHGNTIIDCSREKLMRIPSFHEEFNITEIYLNHNSIGEVPSHAFINISVNLKILDLSHNGQGGFLKLQRNAFSSLHGLKILKLGHNGLRVPDSYPDGIFQDLRELHTLYTLGNNYYEDLHSNGATYPDKIFKYLVSLETLSLNALYPDFTFENGFKKLYKLSFLEVTQYIEESCGRVAIRNTTFENLKNSPIKSLVLRGCAYKSIESGSFAMLKHLKNLNLACATHLSIKDVLVALNEMPGTTLDTLILDGMNMQTNTSFCYKNLRNLRRLSMRDTGISSVEMKIENKCLENLEHLNIAANYPTVTPTYYSTLPLAWIIFGFVFQWPFNGLWSGKPIPVVDASNMLAPPDYVTNNFCKSKEQQFDDYFQLSHVKYVNPPYPDNSNAYGDTPFSYEISPLRLNVLYQSNNFATGFWNSETLQQINQAE